jgi:hypothetical protein
MLSAAGMVAAATTVPSNMRAAAAIKDWSIPWENAPQAASITRWTIEATAAFLLTAVAGPLTFPVVTAVTTSDRY